MIMTLGLLIIGGSVLIAVFLILAGIGHVAPSTTRGGDGIKVCAWGAAVGVLIFAVGVIQWVVG